MRALFVVPLRAPLRAALGLAVVASGCMPTGMNDDCRWPVDARRALDLRRSGDARHLVNDVRVAEELGVRYADSRLRGADIGSGAPRTRDECDARLFATIADSHGVTIADVSAARQQLAGFAWDPAVHLPLAGFYLLLTVRFARAIRNRFPADETAAAVLATLFVSVVLGGLVLALGQLWDGFVEMARVGNQHLTYRALRLGWRQHTPLVFFIAVVFFWVAVLLSYRARSPRASRAAQPVRMK